MNFWGPWIGGFLLGMGFGALIQKCLDKWKADNGTEP